MSRKSADAWFAEADANSNGALDRKESVLIIPSKNHFDNIFKGIDKNKDGTLSPEEIKAYILKTTSAGGH